MSTYEISSASLTTQELELLAELLDLAANEFANHGCNEYAVPNTYQSRELLRHAVIANTGNPESTETIQELKDLENDFERSIDNPTLFTYDTTLMRYLRQRVLAVANRPE